ncbi:MAG: carbohydrate binding domain-containing protein, partial [Bacteroidota bacterium]
MKNLRIYNKLTVAVLGVILSTLFIGCNREEDELPRAKFPATGDIYTNDSFVGLGTDFFFPFIDGGAKPEVFDVDNTEGYVGTSSIRIDVPDADDPGGSFAGATFIIDGFGRNLTSYNALTFWARSTESATISQFGFGVNSSGSQYETSVDNLKLTTNWQKYFIPIPDASKLVNERGMMWFAASGNCPEGEGLCFPETTDGGTKKGYTFWLDEVQFENLGTISQARARIQDGQDATVAAFVGQVIEVSGAGSTYNLPNGIDVEVNTPSAYFNFEASNSGVVSTAGSTITVVGEGTTTVTATLGGTDATGSLTIQTISEAVDPTRDSRNVVSIFSDVYDKEPADFYNGFFIGQTTLGGAIEVAPGKNILSYTDLNFVIPTFTSPTIDASEMTHLHLDIFTFDNTDDALLEIGLVDLGADATFGGGNDVAGTFLFGGAGLVSGTWIPLDIKLDEFDGLGATANIGQLILASANINNLILDNAYFYAESPAQDASLSDILVNGVSLDGFASGILTYPVDVASSGVVPEIAGIPSNEDATVNVNPASAVPGTTTIIVTAPNGVTTKTYSLELVLTDVADVTLSDLQVDGMTIADFSPATTNYTIDLPDGTTIVPMVGATASDPQATVAVTDAGGIPGTTLVVVTGRDGSSQRTYRVNFNAGDVQGPVELLTNGDFENGADPWFTNFGTGVPEIQEGGGNNFFFANVEVAGDAFAVNLSQQIEITQGSVYTLSFDASTGEGTTRKIIAGIGLNEAPFSSATEEVDLTETSQTFSLTFTAADFGNSNSRVLFDLGADVGVVVIDNVSLQGEAGGGTPDPDPD